MSSSLYKLNGDKLPAKLQHQLNKNNAGYKEVEIPPKPEVQKKPIVQSNPEYESCTMYCSTFALIPEVVVDIISQ